MKTYYAEILKETSIADRETDVYNDTNEAYGIVAGLSFWYGVCFIITATFSFLWSNLTRMSATKSDKLTKLFQSTKIPSSNFEVYVIKNDSPNAFVMPFTGPKAFITTGLIKQLTDREIVAIMCHEYFHYSNNHNFKLLLQKSFVLEFTFIFMFWSGMINLQSFIRIIIFWICEYILQTPFNLLFGRKWEYDSDAFATQQGYGKELASGLTKISIEDEKHKKNCNGLCYILMSIDKFCRVHPDTKDRIRKVLEESRVQKDMKSLLMSSQPMTTLSKIKDKYGFSLQSVISTIKGD